MKQRALWAWVTISALTAGCGEPDRGTLEAATAPAVDAETTLEVANTVDRELAPLVELQRRHATSDPAYHFTPARDGAWLARSGEQRLAIRAERAGRIAVSIAGQEVQLELAGVGRGERVTTPRAVSDRDAQGVRVEFRRGELLREWYDNGRLGLEQGFVVMAPPAGSGPLTLELRVGGALRPVRTGNTVALVDAAARRVLAHYGELFALDADRRLLRSSLAVEGGRISLRVDDSRARYPIAIDPLIWRSEAALSVPGLSNTGEHIALDGNAALIGAPQEGGTAGAAYVFVRAGAFWSEPIRLRPLGAPNDNLVGTAVALSAEFALVSSPVHDNLGRVWVFQRSGQAWAEVGTLDAPSGASEDAFGTSVAIDGNRALVGAPGADTHGSGSGSAHAFVWNGVSWVHDGELVPTGAAAGRDFGRSVAISGDTAVVGAPTANGGVGVAHVFARDSDVWQEQGELAGAGGTLYLGQKVALEADTAVVAAALAGSSNNGHVYVFTRSGAAWSLQQELAPEGSTEIGFGRDIGLAGDRVVVGAPYVDTWGANAGGGLVFQRSGSTWSLLEELTWEEPAISEYVGVDVALDGDTVALAGPSRDTVHLLQLVSVGETCSDPNACSAATYCADGVCCDLPCTGPCALGCNESGSEGQCQLRAAGDLPDASCTAYLCDGSSDACPTSCANTAECQPQYYCDGTCEPRRESGTACENSEQCSSGHCVGGLCCDAACDGPCESCELALTAGTCTALAAGAAGDPECGTYLCDGVSGSCPSTCADSAGCAPGNYCDSGSCVALLVAGSPCTDAASCASAECVDGVCCDSACGASNASDCQACSVAAGSTVDGVCGAVASANTCRASTESCDPAESCDGVSLECPADLDECGSGGGGSGGTDGTGGSGTGGNGGSAAGGAGGSDFADAGGEYPETPAADGGLDAGGVDSGAPSPSGDAGHATGGSGGSAASGSGGAASEGGGGALAVGGNAGAGGDAAGNAGAAGAPGSGGSPSARGGGSGLGGSAANGGGTASPEAPLAPSPLAVNDGGCACRTVGSASAPSASWVYALLALIALCRRRGSAPHPS